MRVTLPSRFSSLTFATVFSVLVSCFSVTANAGLPTLVTPTLPEATDASPYNYSLLVGGTPPPTSVVVSGLPAGLTATHNGTGSLKITGTPTAFGTFNLSLLATNAEGSKSFATTLTVVNEQTLRAQYSRGVTTVSTGFAHTCTIVGGEVQCWGDNRWQQLGDGTSAAKFTPVFSATPPNATAVSAGREHTCAIIDGGVQCWGHVGYGLLGDGSTAPNVGCSLGSGCNVPSGPSKAPVQTIRSKSGAEKIAAAAQHTCAVIKGGLTCWGLLGVPKGDGTLSNVYFPTVILSANSAVTDIAVGAYQTCAVVASSVQCWDKLGLYVATSVAVIPNNEGATAVSVGGKYVPFTFGGTPPIVQHACAVVTGGLQCWGSNESGQLGDGTAIDRTTPTQIFAPNSGVTAVSAGETHTCAVLNGGLQCWGSNQSKQRGDEALRNSLSPINVFAANSRVTAVSAHATHTCVVIDGGIQCWGDSTGGKLGSGKGENEPLKIPPQLTLSTNTELTMIAAGAAHNCRLLSGGVQCTGADNDRGQLGDGPAINQGAALQTIAVNSGVTGLSSGTAHSCAVINGGVSCWGDNAKAQLRPGGSTVQALGLLQAIAPAGDATLVSAGHAHTCAVINGGLQCWGDNSTGQLGAVFTGSQPIQVTVIAANGGVQQVASGAEFTCAVINGGLQCWGSLQAVRFPDGGRPYYESFTPLPVIVANSGVVKVAVGTKHICALLDGGLRCFGARGNGQMGDGNVGTIRTVFTTVGVRNVNLIGYFDSSDRAVQTVAAGSGVTDVSARGDITCAVVAGGVQCWGSNAVTVAFITAAFQPPPNAADRTIPVEMIAAGSGATSVSVGDSHVCAIVNGAEVCWGDAAIGRLSRILCF